MVTPKMMMCFIALMVAGLIISMGTSGDYIGSDAWDAISQELTGFEAGDISGIGSIPTAFSGFMENGFPRMVSWNYAFFQSNIAGLQVILSIVQGFFIIVCTGGLLWGIVGQFQSYIIPALIGSGILWGIGSLLS